MSVNQSMHIEAILHVAKEANEKPMISFRVTTAPNKQSAILLQLNKIDTPDERNKAWQHLEQWLLERFANDS